MSRSKPLGVLAAGLIALTVPTGLRSQVVLGARGGLNLATVGGDDTENTSTRTGLNLGGTLRFALTDVVSLQLGAGYSSKGTKDRDEEAGEMEVRVGYVEAPVLLRFDLPSSSRASAHFALGPAFGFKTKCEVEGKDQGVQVTLDCAEMDATINDFDVGAMGGVGADLGLDNGMAITADVLYTWGFSDVIDDPDQSIHNRVFSFLVGLSYPVG